ncbi:divergent polysaccharide deacetylase family protein [Glycocaulis profundi]|nr:divergent polysaccharide deacetylase family protein [Glycocaulis profundi]
MARRPDTSSPLKKPLIAGLCAALLCAAGIGALAVMGETGSEPVGARAFVEAPPAPEPVVIEPTPPGQVLVYAEAPAPEFEPVFADGEGASLPGVSEGEQLGGEVQPPPNSNAARAMRRASLRNESLIEPGADGPLPRIGDDGLRPSRAYARSFAAEPNRPKIAIVVGGLGVSESLTDQAIERLPAEITLSFVPYARDLQDWIDRARLAGHEVLIELPMEPFDYPANDPGPHTLLVEAGEAENARRLEWLLSRAQGYFGVTNYLGARLTGEAGPMAIILERLERRGLAVFHDGEGRRGGLAEASQRSDVPIAIADRILDADPTPAQITERLIELEAVALQNGHALGSAFAFPAAIDTLAAWSREVEATGYQIVPASHVHRVRAERSGRGS